MGISYRWAVINVGWMEVAGGGCLSFEGCCDLAIVGITRGEIRIRGEFRL